ncbi:EAL domain-containing protein, partial [Escherichia sp. R-CC3]
LEITERDMLKEQEATQLFAWLHSVGVEIAIDDFGTGHSALGNFQHNLEMVCR